MKFISMKNSAYFLILLCILSAYFFLSHKSREISIQDEAKYGVLTKSSVDFSLASNTKHSINTLPASATDSQQVLKKDAVVWRWGDEVQIAELAAWQASHGWYDLSDANKDDYKTYSKEVLQQLANNGDLKALQLLVKGSLSPERERLLLKASIYGSTFALGQLADSVETQGHIKNDTPDADKRNILINAAAYLEVMKMRGDLLVAQDGFESIQRRQELVFTDVDYKLISDKAKEIYSNMERQRTALGLEKFNNTLPPIVEAYYKASGVYK